MRRLLIDVTRTLQSGQHTGIQRVVRRLWQALREAGRAGQVEVWAVVFEGKGWRCLAELPLHPLEMAASTGLPGQMPCRPPSIGAGIKPGAGDVVLMADASWYIDPWPAVDAALGQGATLAGFIHDLLPLQQPQWFRPELQPRFAWHLAQLMERASLLITPSEVVRAAVQQHLAGQQAEACPALPVVCQPLGADFLLPDASSAGSELAALPGILTPTSTFALMVGTIEPRKNHQLVLQVFEHLWAQGSALQLVLVGAPGWCAEAVMQRIQTHAELGGRLHWFSHLKDAQLHTLYSRARALVFASLDEGFGLPIAEAAYLGCPVLATDLPVLHEAGGRWPTYLPAQGVADWVQALQGLQPEPALVPQVRNWAEVAMQLLGTLKGMHTHVAPAPVPPRRRLEMANISV